MEQKIGAMEQKMEQKIGAMEQKDVRAEDGTKDGAMRISTTIDQKNQELKESLAEMLKHMKV